ncbi:HtaA domain-containing protein [Streptomyces sp. SHP 1-2]|uniref:HtaA domain-containing protein n=1 Tax=Streptomyces sp. SHP 1-2 TaxID=2769489 RepID=UPI0022391492|nr:HtaA domain-containing protein [Streptomyces sp. SHP 1-2]MCW5249158.1 HtaA domain-containing protein [Streptomyces sp. SHP 1-2]
MPARLRALVTVVCAAVLGALLPLSAAHAEARNVQGGRLDWGIKSSFQSYVTGPVAKGGYSLTGGAATVGGSTFRFHSANGSYDGSTGTFGAAFAGGVRFVGHRAADGSHQLDLTVSSPTVRISGGGGTLFVDIVSKSKETGAVTTARQVPFASLSLGGVNMRGDGNAVVLNNLPATLTAQGARAFAGFYGAGTPLDPVSLAADVRPAAADTRPTETPRPTEKAPEAEKKPKKSDEGTALRDGAVDWGVRRTFREYVTGDIADGKWTLTGGAQDGGALFRFPGGKGTFRDGALDASFTGTLRFTGAHGLDLALSSVRVTVKGEKGTLFADVAAPGLTAKKVALVTFAAGKLKPADGLVSVTEAPAKLTGRGAKAFGGMYRGGTEMDPVSLAVALTGDAELPALPDLGSAATESAEDPATASAAPQPSAAPETSAEPVAASSGDGGFPALAVGIAGGALLLVAGGLGALALRRRRAATAAGAASAADSPDRAAGSPVPGADSPDPAAGSPAAPSDSPADPAGSPEPPASPASPGSPGDTA